MHQYFCLPMKTFLALVFVFCVSTNLLADTYLEHWNWSSIHDGKEVGEMFTWWVPNDLHDSLPKTNPLVSVKPFMSQAATEAAIGYVKERVASYNSHGMTEDFSRYTLVAFGYREVPRRFDQANGEEPTGKWLRYLEYNGGLGSMAVKVYLLPDDTVLRPKIEPVKNK